MCISQYLNIVYVVFKIYIFYFQGERLSEGDGFGMEFVLTFIYVMTILCHADPSKITAGSLKHYALQIGFTTAALVFVGVRSS